MKTHNLIGYAILVMQAAALAFFAPPALGTWLGMTLGLVYFTSIWFLSGLYLSDIIHMESRTGRSTTSHGSSRR